MFPACVLVLAATALAPAPVPTSLRCPYRQHRLCRSCQDHRFTARATVLHLPVSTPRRTPTGPASKFQLLEPFSALSFRLGALVRGVSTLYRALSLSPPPPALPLDSGSVSHLRTPPPTDPSLFSSYHSFFLPAPVPSLDSSSVSHLRRAPTNPLFLFSSPQLVLLPRERKCQNVWVGI